MAFAQVLYPLLQGPQAFDAALLKMFRFFWILCFIIIGFTWLLSGFVVQLMNRQAYLKAKSVLNIYVLNCIPVFMGVGQGLWLVNERKSYLSPIQTVTGAVVCIVANFLLLLLWGINGAAVAAVLAQLCPCFLINSIFARNLFVMQIGFRSRNISN